MKKINEIASFRALVADDESVIRDYWQLLLASMFKSVEVDAVNSAKAVLEKLPTKKYDLIVLDIGLRTGMSGLDLIPEIRFSKTENEKAPIMVHSGRDNPELVQAAMRVGASAYMSKGAASIDEIKDGVRTVVEGGVYLPKFRSDGFLNEIAERNRTSREAVLDVVYRFPPRQREVAQLMYLGLTEVGIAERLGLAGRDSVRTHVRLIYKSLGVYSRAQFMSLLGTYVIKPEHFIKTAPA